MTPIREGPFTVASGNLKLDRHEFYHNCHRPHPNLIKL